MPGFRLTPDAIDDLDAIWKFIFKDSPAAAGAVTVPKYRNYVIVYRTDSKPLEIIRVLHGMRNLKELMK